MFNNLFNFEKIFEAFNYVFWFFLLNLFFMAFNIPLILFFTFVGISNIFEYFPLFLICLLPTMPTFTALLYCMNKIITNKDLEIIKDFIKGIKLNFKQSFLIWFIELSLINILYINIRFFTLIKHNIILTCLFSTILIVLAIVTPYISILISRFKMKTIDTLRTAFILSFTRPILTITNLLLFIFTLIIFEVAPGTVILFISSLLSFLLLFVNKSLLLELDSISKEQNI
ncbi:MAG: YesL family protein [Clostridium sp.]|nr:YesL family protein [Clostridium sp.]